MELIDIVRKEIDIGGWKDSSELAERVLVRLNNLHRDAVQRMLTFEAQIREAGGEPDVEVIVTFPEPPPMPEPEPREVF